MTRFLNTALLSVALMAPVAMVPALQAQDRHEHSYHHHRQLSRMIELEARYPFSTGKDRRLGQFPKLSAVDKCLQDILLDIVVVVDDLGPPVAK